MPVELLQTRHENRFHQLHPHPISQTAREVCVKLSASATGRSNTHSFPFPAALQRLECCSPACLEEGRKALGPECLAEGRPWAGSLAPQKGNKERNVELVMDNVWQLQEKKKENMDGWRGLLKSPQENIHNFQTPLQGRNIITLLSCNVVIHI